MSFDASVDICTVRTEISFSVLSRDERGRRMHSQCLFFDGVRQARTIRIWNLTDSTLALVSVRFGSGA